jgi:hypothetical protein
LLSGGLIAQVLFEGWLLKKKRLSEQETSRALFMQALTYKQDVQKAYPLIRKALLLRLYEVHETPSIVSNPEELQTFGIQGDIRKFLLSVDQRRFSGLAVDMETKELIEEASQLYFRLKINP